MVHTENFVLVDAKRRVRGFYDGTKKEEIKRLIEDINFLCQDKNDN
jgi:protein SCO1/2